MVVVPIAGRSAGQPRKSIWSVSAGARKCNGMVTELSGTIRHRVFTYLLQLSVAFVTGLGLLRRAVVG
jgi:hypothetical protein